VSSQRVQFRSMLDDNPAWCCSPDHCSYPGSAQRVFRAPLLIHDKDLKRVRGLEQAGDIRTEERVGGRMVPYPGATTRFINNTEKDSGI
jgi:hypothetical protein